MNDEPAQSGRSVGPAWPPRGMPEREAAYYVGLSASTFRREVAAGTAPSPVRMTKGRQVWLREDLDRWLDAKAGRAAPSASGNPWLDRLYGAG